MELLGVASPVLFFSFKDECVLHKDCKWGDPWSRMSSAKAAIVKPHLSACDMIQKHISAAGSQDCYSANESEAV